MAGDNTRSPSSPLPPDPAPRTAPAMSSQIPQFHEPFVESPLTTGSPHPEPTGKRIDSRRSSVRSQQQPIEDALNNAFQQSDAQLQMSQKTMEALAAQVAKILSNQQQEQLAPSTSPKQHRQTFFPQPPLPQQSEQEPTGPMLPPSPAWGSVGSVSGVFTPSPSRDLQGREWSPPPSPGPPRSDAGSVASVESAKSLKTTHSRKSSLTPRGSVAESSGENRRSSTMNDPPRNPITADILRSASETTARAQPPNRRYSRGSEAGFEDMSRNRVRTSRESSITEEMTEVEKAWRPLFENGAPTARLGQFLRGIALHLIEFYEPKNSLVVTPSKMQRFFNETKVNEEYYPWDIIFGCEQMDATSLSTMYRNLRCQHHLVQRSHHDAPSLPGLTPLGFEGFMTFLIQAHPDTEYQRLSTTLILMPINNADERSDRFPKELIRRQLPAQGNNDAELRLASSLSHVPDVMKGLKNIASIPPPPARKASVRERERQPYSGSPKRSNAVPDEDLAPTTPPAVQIERERNPYFGKEGLGRMFENEDRRQSYQNVEPQSGGPRPLRGNSGVPPQSTYPSSGPTNPTIIPPRANSSIPLQSTYPNNGPPESMNAPPRTQHRGSVSQHPPPPISMQNGNHQQASRPSRGRSSPPPTRNNFGQRSDPYNLSNIPAQQFGSNLYPAKSNPNTFPSQPVEDQSRFPRSKSRPSQSNTGRSDHRDEDGRGDYYQGQSQSRPMNIPSGGRAPLPPQLGPSTGPPNGPALGTSAPGQPSAYLPRRPTGPSGSDDRRRSMYSVPSASMGGTDGYGSYGNGNYPPPH